MQKRPAARIGLIGAGWWATTAHLPALVAHPHAVVAGVADLDVRRARETAAYFDVPFFTTHHRELLELDLDGVIISTPHDSHFAAARDALIAGSDVLIEKPMVIEVSHGREILEIAREKGRRVHVGYPFPYTRHARRLRQSISDGHLGDIVLATSLFASSVLPLYQGAPVDDAPMMDGVWPSGGATYSDPRRGGGQLLTQVTHSASLLFFLTELKPRTVFAVTHDHNTEVDVWDAIAFQTAEGAVASLTSTATVDRNIEEYRVFGTKGHAALDTRVGTLALTFYGAGTEAVTPLEPPEIYPSDAPARRLVDSILDDEPVIVPGELGLLTAELLEAARVSAETGAAVSVSA